MAVLEKNIMKRAGRREEREQKEFDERVVEVQRVSRVVKGGRRIRFRALVVIGDHKGRLGMGVAKANEVAEAVRKATSKAKKNVVNVPVINGTIPHEVFAKYSASRIMLKPASEGTTIVAGGSVRTVVELAGITDILAKIQGSTNKINNVTATIKALCSFRPDIVEKIRNISQKSEIVKTQVNKSEEELIPELIEPITTKEKAKKINEGQKATAKEEKAKKVKPKKQVK
jgi:small subunit ribosomal protein S5